MKVELFYSDHETKLRLLEYHAFSIDEKQFTIEKGFVFNGASIPRFFWRIEQPINAKYLECFCEHDALYSSHWVDRKTADDFLYKRLRECGMNWFKANGIYYAVRCFGGSHYKAA